MRLPRWADTLFYVAFILLLASAAAFVALNQLNNAAKSDLEETKDKIAVERASVQNKVLEERVLGYKQKIENFVALLATHKNTAQFFKNLESSTHPFVWFFDIALDAQKFSVKLAGRAKDFTAVGQQLSLLAENPNFKDINFSDPVLTDKGEVEFSLQFLLDPIIFK